MKAFAVLLVALIAGAVPAAAQSNVDGFVAKVHRGAHGTMPYRLFTPSAYRATQQYPLVLWLHGAGSVGDDNFKQISGASLRGTHTWTSPGNQSKHPTFVVAPQTKKSWEGDQLTIVLEILASLQASFNIDANRIYIAGQSMGGHGTWNLITLKPEIFAAAIPLCGWGDSRQAAAIAKIPIWAFHGADDPTVSVISSRSMIEAIRKAGGTPRYTEYKNVGHEVWLQAFREPELVAWLFGQHK